MENQVLQVQRKNSMPPNKNGFIEFCRFVFMMGIVSHHAMFISAEPGFIPFWGGYISVEFFFILTGYLLYSSYLNKPIAGDKQDSAIYQVYHKFKQFYPYFFISWCTTFIMVHVESGNITFRTLFWDFIFGIPQLLFLQCEGLAGVSDNYNGPMWFASALLIGILVVYPLMCYCKKYFATAIAPALCLICYGHVMKTGASLGSVHEWAGVFQVGCLRAIGGLCLGAFCYYIANLLSPHHLTKSGNITISLLQFGLLAFSLYLMCRTYGYTDIVQVMLFSILIILSFAEKTMTNRIFNRKIFFTLGKISMIVFVTQCAAYKCPSILLYPENWPLRYGMYLIYVLSFSLLNYLIVENIRHLNIAQNLKQWLLRV